MYVTSSYSGEVSFEGEQEIIDCETESVGGKSSISKSRDHGPRASKNEYAIECSNNFILLIRFSFCYFFFMIALTSLQLLIPQNITLKSFHFAKRAQMANILYTSHTHTNNNQNLSCTSSLKPKV